jgi:trans-feruloyl-CoA hydratase/vanillin synthase
MAIETRDYRTIKVEREDGIAWLILNRPEKRNAMNPTMHYEFLDALIELESDPAAKVVVITGAGASWCAGMDLKEFFRDLDNNPRARRRVNLAGREGGWYRLSFYPKPTIAMVNGYCFGGAFTRLIACDFAIAADDAIFGLSEINWGIFPGGIVSRLLADAMTLRDAMYYILTGDTFTGAQAAAMKVVTAAVPRDRLREETVALAQKLMTKNPHTLRAAKEVFKAARTMTYWQAEEYMAAKAVALKAIDSERGYDQGIKQFIDEKRYRPGLGAYHREG